MVEEKLNYKEFLKEMDKEIEMIPLTFDVVLKGIFERNLDLLKRFLISILNLDIDVDNSKIILSNNELPKENTNEYQKRVDILVVINNNVYVDVEANRGDFRKFKHRNSMYNDKIYTIILETGQKSGDLSKFCLYQLNLNIGDKFATMKEDEICLYSAITKEKFIDNKIMVLKYLEFFRDEYYTNVNSLSEGEIWLAALTAESFTELDEMLSHILSTKDRKRLVKEAIRMSKLDFSICEWETEKISELMREEASRIDREDGIAEGRAEGIEQNTIEIIKNLIDKDMKVEDISDVTGKSIEEIENIKTKLY